MNSEIFSCQSASPLIKVPIVLLNGWGMGNDSWQSLMPDLQAFADVIVVNVTYENNIDALCKKIVQQLPAKSVLVGWSLGGMLATNIAASYPASVVALITLASNVKFVASTQWPEAMPEKTFADFYNAFEKSPIDTLASFKKLIVHGDKTMREQKRYLHKVDNRLANDALEGLTVLKKMNNISLIKDIVCPALHVFGENDVLVPVTAVDNIRRLNKQHQYHTMAGAGHLLHHPSERLFPVVENFLREIR